jgi:exodeoxyribonuclease VII large subunit
LGIVTVSELNRVVAQSLERNFPMVQVRGEIAQLTQASSGHLYFSLRDRSASVRAVMFKGKVSGLAWQPREGDEVELSAAVSIYEPRGDFQLRVEAMRRSGAGALYEAFLARKAKLAKAGLFEEGRKKALPQSIDTVAVVTSLEAAALRDVVVTLSRLAPSLRIRLYPALVQGSDAPAMLRQQLERAGSDPWADVLLLVRGGGSLEDLWAFNDEGLAYAIANCPLPVVVGVGHETDVTLADLVADLRAATPTAAAQAVAEPHARARERLERAWAFAAQHISKKWSVGQQRLDLIAGQLRSPKERLRERQHRLALVTQGLQALMRARASGASAQLVTLSARLAALDPTAILQRGYAIVTDSAARIVSRADQASPGDCLRVQLAKGLLDVRVNASDPATDGG